MSPHPSFPTAFAFPGVGVLPCGAEADFLAHHRETVEPFLAQASEAAGADLAAALEQGRLGELEEKEADLFAYAFGCGAAAVYGAAGARPRWVAGYSLGIYAALWNAGAVSYKVGLELVGKARDLMACTMQSEARHAVGVVVGLDDRDVEELLQFAGCPSVVSIIQASELSSVVAGRYEEVESILSQAKSRGAPSSRMLSMDAPVHHPVLRGASEQFRAYMESLPWSAPVCPVISSIDQRLLTEVGDLKNFTAANLSTPIHWQRVVEALQRLGAAVVFECGAGVSLSQSARFIATAPRHVSLRNWRKGIRP